MSRPAVFADMADAFTSGLGNADALINTGSSSFTLRGIFRKIRETDLLDIEGMGLEGVSYSFAAGGMELDQVHQKNTLTIVQNDDGVLIGKVFLVAGVVDDGRAMRRLLLHEDE